MIERYTLKFGPAITQKELEKLLQEGLMPSTAFNNLKARIEIVGNFADLQKVDQFLKTLSKP